MDGLTESVLKEALEQFEESQEGTAINREEADKDIRFGRLGDQWPEKVKKQRELEGRPVLTINTAPAYIRQVSNEIRQNKPSLIVSPVDNGADPDTAEVIGGLIRSIWRDGGDAATDTAADHALSCGFGFFRIGLDYVSPDSFSMKACIERIANPLSVHWDPSTTAVDASDWRFCFVSDFMSEDEYEATYPGAEKVSFEKGSRDSVSHWLQDDQIRVAEWFSRESATRKLLLLSDGSTARLDEIPDMVRKMFAAAGMEPGAATDDELVQVYLQGRTVQKEREAEYHKVMRRIISGAEVLEEEEWPGSLIPVCPVWGEEVFVDGYRHFRSMIRDAKDPMVMRNFWRSASTELVALAPRAPFIGPKGFVPTGEEQKWQTANTRSHAYLEYEGQVPPQRQPFAGVPAGAVQEAMNAATDIQDITGIYPSSIGARSNETSGRAILTRERQGDIANFHFIDNLARAIRYAGKCLLEIVPSVYSQRDAIRILGEDMTEKVVKLGQGQVDGEKLYDLSVGNYDVVVKSGPSYATQREETREALIEIVSRLPDAAVYLGDVLMEHMDFPGADKVAKRLKFLLPPQVQQAESEAMKEIPPEAQQMLAQAQAQTQQMQQQMQMMGQELQRLQGEAQSKQADMQAKMAETERRALEAQEKAQNERDRIRADYEMRVLELRQRDAEARMKSEDADKDRIADIVKQIIAEQNRPEGAMDSAEEFAALE